MLQNTLTNRRGFSLAEMVLVVAVLAILLGISTPSLFGFIKQRDIQTEENTLQEMRRALQAYVADKNALPPAASWATALAGYTNLSAAEMGQDQWGTARAYVPFTDTTRTIQGAPVPINYATILSAGPNRLAAAAAGIAVASDAFAPLVNTTWWAAQTTPALVVASFGALAAREDDLMVKFTDYPEKLERYNLTLQRMDRVANAVESVSRVRYSEVVAYCSGNTTDVNCTTPGTIEKWVYYPIGLPTAGGASAAGLHRYEAIYAAAGTPASDQVQVNNGGTEAQRRADMVKLMRLLGLPDDFCCSALELASDNLPKAFYYFSNPRPRGISGGCSTRPGFTDQKLPARLGTQNNDAASPPTCG